MQRERYSNVKIRAFTVFRVTKTKLEAFGIPDMLSDTSTSRPAPTPPHTEAAPPSRLPIKTF